MPSIDVVLIDVPVMLPEFVTVKFPPPVVISSPLRTKLTPTRVIPADPFVERAPARFIVPVEVAFRERAEKFWIVMLLELETVVAPRGVMLPAAADNVISPVPAAIDRLPGPSRVLENKTG